MPHLARSLPPSKRHSRLTIVRRGCKTVTKCRDSWRSHVHRTHTAQRMQSFKLKTANVRGQGGSPPCLSLGVPKGVFSLEREYPLWCRGAHAAPPPALAREKDAALPRCQFRFPYGKTISPEAKSCRGRREHENADAARSVPPARRCWRPPGSCPAPFPLSAWQ